MSRSQSLSDKSKRLQRFYNRFYTYVNQIFGDYNIRKKIKDFFLLPTYSLEVIETDDALGTTWQHHIAKTVPSEKVLCSAELNYQDPYSLDTACQSYSIYNVLYFNKKFIIESLRKNKPENIEIIDMLDNLKKLQPVSTLKRNANKRKTALKNNTKKIVDLFLWLLEQEEIINEINDFNFIRFDDLVSGSGKYINNPVKKLKTTLNDWKDYGYEYFLKKDTS